MDNKHNSLNLAAKICSDIFAPNEGYCLYIIWWILNCSNQVFMEVLGLLAWAQGGIMFSLSCFMWCLCVILNLSSCVLNKVRYFESQWFLLESKMTLTLSTKLSGEEIYFSDNWEKVMTNWAHIELDANLRCPIILSPPIS